MRATYPVHKKTFNVLTLTLSSHAFRLWSSSLAIFSILLLLILAPNTFLSPLFSNTFNLLHYWVVFPPKAHTTFRQLLLDIQHASIHLRDTNSQNGVSTFLRSSTWVSEVCLYYRLATTYNENILIKNMIRNLKLWSSTHVLTSTLTDWLMVNRLQYFSRSIH